MSEPFDFRSCRFSAQNFKCFDSWETLPGLCPVNLVLGRNNVGKSAILDFIEQLSAGLNNDPRFYRENRSNEIKYEIVISQDMIESSLQTLQVGDWNNAQVREKAKKFCLAGKIVRESSAAFGVVDHYFSKDGQEFVQDPIIQVFDAIHKSIHNPLSRLKIVRLRADRDIMLEPKNNCDQVEPNGRNATSIVQMYCHRNRFSKLVTIGLLNDLNAIMEPDWHFNAVLCKQYSGETWELCLEDSNGTIVSLSDAGSGVKTILLVLVNLHLVPHAQNRPLDRFLYCFEELENNLHPAVQRRLFRFLREQAVQTGCRFLLTTHSSVVIDMFSADPQTQIVHVTNDGKRAHIQPVSAYLHNCAILDDLDVRASDLLQANVLIWLEGPSDRLYFNRWMELWSDGSLKEHVHYQCVWYGGSLLANVSFDVPDSEQALVAALKVNRHAIVVMDSDRRAENDELKARVERVREEVMSQEALAWVTDCREVENYIPHEALQKALDKPELGEIGKWDDVFGASEWSRDRKMDLAHRVLPTLAKESLQGRLDLANRLDAVCAIIRKWNGLPPLPAQTA